MLMVSCPRAIFLNLGAHKDTDFSCMSVRLRDEKKNLHFVTWLTCKMPQVM